MDEESRIKKEADLRQKWGFEDAEKDEEKPWKFDGNTITPGTTFMKNVAKALRNYIMERQNNHYLW